MVSFLEASSNLIYVVILAIIVRTGYLTLLQFITPYMLILPYAFLMNTSHNKNRVIEHGWKNVFMNVVRKGNNSAVILYENNQKNANNSKELDSKKTSDNQGYDPKYYGSDDSVLDEGKPERTAELHEHILNQTETDCRQEPGTSGCSSLILDVKKLKIEDTNQDHCRNRNNTLGSI